MWSEVLDISNKSLESGRMMKGSSMENRGKRQAASIFGGMGFYIALLVCVLAAGVVGYFALLNDGNSAAETGEDTDPLLVVDQVEEGDAAPVATPPDPAPQPVMGEDRVVITAPIERTEEPEPSVDTAPVSGQAEDTIPVDASAQSPEELSRGPITVVNPVAGEAVAVFSVDQLVYDETLGDWRTHDGLDLQAAAGSAVSAAAGGTVLSVVDDDRMGTTVTIEHDGGYVTTYASLHPEVMVEAGDTVDAGTVIGTVGTTALAEMSLGEHVHFSVARDGEVVDPVEFLG